MSKNPYSKLFDPVQIGPVVTKNRFYQVPHCCGMGHVRPRAHAAMRGVKAKGGWVLLVQKRLRFTQVQIWLLMQNKGFGTKKIFLLSS